jgi:hypothetical protein
MTGASDVAAALSKWCGRNRAVGLILPRGWFGRPYDNNLQLTWAHGRGTRLFVELDGELVLIATGDVSGRETREEFVVGARQFVFDRQEYGAEPPKFHAEVFADGGEVRFVALGVPRS